MSHKETGALFREFADNETHMREVARLLHDRCSHHADAPAEARRVAESWGRSAYENAFQIIFSHAESPIERQFLCGLTLALVQADPLGYCFTPPAQDVLSQIANLRRTIGLLPAKLAPFKNPSPEQYALQQFWLRYVGLNFANALHITPQAGVAREDGRSARLDMLLWIPALENPLIAVECDGYEWHTNREQFTRDRSRDRELGRLGIETLRFSGSEIHGDPKGVITELLSHVRKRLETK